MVKISVLDMEAEKKNISTIASLFFHSIVRSTHCKNTDKQGIDSKGRRKTVTVYRYDHFLHIKSKKYTKMY